MMVETILESSQDFGMANGVGVGVGGGGGGLPQWKRELLQRRAARARPPPPAPPAPPPPPPAGDDEELRYGPGIVKRLKSRYLSLALRDAPRRRPSVLRRAASLEHLLDAPQGPSPRPPRPASAAQPPRPAPRRDFVKRARSVDALSRLESRDEPRAPPSPPPLPPQPRPSVPRSARPPRRPAPLLRDAERPPPDLVRTTLRKFEPAPLRRAHPLSAPPATPPPEPSPRSPSPAPPTPPPASDEPEGCAVSVPRPVTRAALEGIARAGSSTRYAFDTPCRGGHLPPLAATNQVLLGRARRVGVIRPMPSPALARATSTPVRAPMEGKLSDEPQPQARRTTPRDSPGVEDSPPRSATPPAPPPPAEPEASPSPVKREPPSALVEPIPRSPPDEPPPPPPPAAADVDPPSAKPACRPRPEITAAKPKPLVNGFRDTESPEPTAKAGAAPWSAGPLRAAARPRAPPPAATSVVFNFSNRKEVPDYVENDGLILRASRRDRVKAGEPGVVALRPGAGRGSDSDESDGEGPDGDDGVRRPVSPCRLRFVNDNVLINGRSSLLASLAARDPHRISRLKLQFDDSLTRTFEYPSETSLCEDATDSPAAAADSPAADSPANDSPAVDSPVDAPAHAYSLAANTHMASASLSRYTPSKSCAAVFQLGMAPSQSQLPSQAQAHANVASAPPSSPDNSAEAESGACEGDARPCGADAARSWSDARARTTDLLF